ncbi:UNVERIFIED_CONTAM: Filament-like plant protein 3 [Sesamum radiatum]|uniref:Filament-like plant protein 3 n=1 Tax=Sesamum radiatum TaxID=300843 RepID=A0AAW2V449_SESRA
MDDFLEMEKIAALPETNSGSDPTARVDDREREVEKERNLLREAAAKCDILEAELSRMKSDSQFQRSAIIEEFRINQDKEVAVAASKFAECQKTIASLDRQLKALATLEDFLIDSDRPVAVL